MMLTNLSVSPDSQLSRYVGTQMSVLHSSEAALLLLRISFAILTVDGLRIGSDDERGSIMWHTRKGKVKQQHHIVRIRQFQSGLEDEDRQSE
ncbi:hypothetical protein VTO42DRAFT_3689 [Malbranchea cinnamomea]